MDFQKTTLNNGLRVITAPMPSMESATVEVFVGAGTKHEKKRVNGLAHFLEHMVFKGTKKYPTAQGISSLIDGIGGEINAHTGKEDTAYYIKAWDKHLDLAFDLLSEFIKHPLLEEKEIEKEKGVILEEIAMYEDLPMQKAPWVFEELLYKDSLGWDIAGKKETVSRITQKDFIDYREAFYHSRNMVVGVAGRFDKDKVLGMARKAFGNVTGNSLTRDSLKKERVTMLQANELPRVNPSGKPELKVINKKTEQAHIVLGVRGNPLGHPDRYKEAVLAVILGGGMSSRLFSEIREKRGLAYYVKSYVEHFKDRGYFASRSGVKLEKVKEAAKIILEQYAKSKTPALPAGRQNEVKEKELAKAKEYLKGRIALSLEDTHSVVEFFGDQEILERKIETPKEIMEGIDKVTVEDVNKVASEIFQNSRLNLVIVGPYDDPHKFEKLLKF